MTYFFLASHGRLASGMKSSMEILTGESRRLTVFDAYVDESSLEEATERFIEGLGPDDDGVLLSDIYGGSVNSVLYTFLDRPRIRLVAGVNLPLVIGLLLAGETLDADSLERIIEESREGLRIVTLEDGGEEEGELF